MNAPFPMPDATDPALATQAGLKTRLREGSADYPGIVCGLNNRWRVIVCPDGLQWILQHRQDRRGVERWDADSFCVTREGLLRCIGERAGYCDLAALQFLASLPDVVGGTT